MPPAAAPTLTGAPPEACPCPKSSAARSATWPAKSSTPYAPTTPESTVDIYRSVLRDLPQPSFSSSSPVSGRLRRAFSLAQFLEFLGGFCVHAAVGVPPGVQSRRARTCSSAAISSPVLPSAANLFRPAQLAHDVLRGTPLPTAMDPSSLLARHRAAGLKNVPVPFTGDTPSVRSIGRISAGLTVGDPPIAHKCARPRTNASPVEESRCSTSSHDHGSQAP